MTRFFTDEGRMGEAAKKLQIGPSRTLHVRGWNRSAPILLASASLYCFALGLFDPLQRIIQGQSFGIHLFQESFFYLLPAFVFVFFFRYAIQAMVPYESVEVSDSSVRVTGKNFSHEILYSNVSKVEIDRRPFQFAAFRLISKDETSYHFPQFLERSEYIIDRLVHARPVFAQDFRDYRASAVIGDHRMARWVGRTQHFLIRTLVLGPLAAAIYGFFIVSKNPDLAGHLWNDPWVLIRYWADLVIFDALSCIWAETAFTYLGLRWLKQNPGKVVRNLRREAGLFRILFAAYLAYLLYPFIGN